MPHAAAKRGGVSAINLFKNPNDAQTCHPGYVFFREGDPHDGMYVVLSGEVELTMGGRKLDTVGAGGVFGEIALIEEGNRMATAVAVTDCRFVFVDEKRFAFLVQQTPYFAIEVMRLLVARIRKLDRELGLPI